MGTDEKIPSRNPPAPKGKASLWRRATTVVIGAGALASAITAIIALWPDPDPVDKVAITSVDLRWPQPLSSYSAAATIEPLGAPATGPDPSKPPVVVPRAWAGTPTVTDGGETPSEPSIATSGQATQSSGDDATTSSSEAATETSSDATESTSDATESSSEGPAGSTDEETTASVTGATSSTTSSPSESDEADISWSPYILPGREEERERLWDEVTADPALSAYLLPESAGTEKAADTASEEAGDVPVSVVLAFSQDTFDPRGKPLPTAEAAGRLAARLEAVRTVPNGGKRDPVGVAATVNLEIQGLRGQSLVLYWRLLPADGSAVVPEVWAEPTPASRLTATTEADTGALDVWVPVPEGEGQYAMDLLVLMESEQAVLDSHRTGPFG